jgi:hypothetical protein
MPLHLVSSIVSMACCIGPVCLRRTHQHMHVKVKLQPASQSLKERQELFSLLE